MAAGWWPLLLLSSLLAVCTVLRAGRVNALQQNLGQGRRPRSAAPAGVRELDSPGWGAGLNTPEQCRGVGLNIPEQRPGARCELNTPGLGVGSMLLGGSELKTPGWDVGSTPQSGVWGQHCWVGVSSKPQDWVWAQHPRAASGCGLNTPGWSSYLHVPLVCLLVSYCDGCREAYQRQPSHCSPYLPSSTENGNIDFLIFLNRF